MEAVKSHLYGFEDYSILCISDSCFYSQYGFYVSDRLRYIDSDKSIICKDLPVRIYNDPTASYYNEVRFDPEICIDHKDLLSTTKKVYVHPNCKISRTLLSTKYKKSLDPYLADVVVVPKINPRQLDLYKAALFINESAKIIFKICIYDDRAKDKISEAEKGTLFKDLITCDPSSSNEMVYKVLESEFFYYGDILNTSKDFSYIIDILTNSIPSEKIVFENSIQESLSDTSNQITFDNIVSITDMLNSSDTNTVSAGLKALSMLDWTHYTNSIKYILSDVAQYTWKYNHACSSTSVKYMLKSLSGSTNRRNWPGRGESEIYSQDYELFKQLKMYYAKVGPDKILDYIKYESFVSVASDGRIRINIKS